MRRYLIAVCMVLATWVAGFAQTALPRLAVVEFSTNDKSEKVLKDAITVRNLTESQMVTTRKYQIITRDEIDKLLKNQQIAVSSISSSENIRKLQLQNISYIVTGSVDAMGSDYAITVKVLDVSTGQFSHSANDFISGNARELYTGVNTLVNSFVGGMGTDAGGKITQTGSGSTASGATYKIGDTGPGGGIVFYDKGVYESGWRYLEAAPHDFTNVQWGARGTNVDVMKTDTGSGKQNTERIVAKLKALGESGRAVQLCVALNDGGYTDWFLPSKDELDLMYRNLKVKGLGNFTNSWYWSSSESSSDYAWYQNFIDGSQYCIFFKDNPFNARAVRAF